MQMEKLKNLAHFRDSVGIGPCYDFDINILNAVAGTAKRGQCVSIDLRPNGSMNHGYPGADSAAVYQADGRSMM